MSDRSAPASGLVVRFGDHDEDFAKDRIAASWQQPGLPVPKFIDMGEALGTLLCRHRTSRGKFLDQLTRNEVAEVLPSLFRTLDAERQIPVQKRSDSVCGTVMASVNTTRGKTRY